GLTGIPAKTDTISRPLLHCSPAEIMEYAKDQSIAWREDASNLDTKYLRNNIRHNIVPYLKELHPTFLDNFLRTQEYLADTVAVAQTHIYRIRQQLFVKGDNLEKVRSEEHTSELQSRENLVCRLLLEKKKTKKFDITHYR